MLKYFLALCSCLLLSLSLHAQSKDAKEAQPQLFQPSRYQMTVSANPAPAPLLQLTLLPSSRERVAGNAALGYFRAIVLQPAWPRDPEASRKLADQLIKWEETPTEKLPTKEVGEYLKNHRNMFRAVDEAARMNSIDWQARSDRAEEISAILESVQGFRELARFLKLRFRLEMAENRLPDAIRTIQTTMQLGKHLAEGSNMIQMLVGLAIARIALGEVQEFLQHPKAPNLYWALATLPKPLVDPRPALDGESRLSMSFIPSLKNLENDPVTEAEANRALSDTIKLMSVADSEDKWLGMNNFFGTLGAATMANGLAQEARKDLLAMGRESKTLEAMPAAQLVLLRAAATHRRNWDEQVSRFYLPFPMASEQFDLQRKQQADAVKQKKDPLLAVFNLLSPAVEKCHFSHAYVGRTVAELQVLESIRLHAARHGRWPQNLAEITFVPVPSDPITDKPFEYVVATEGFTLTAPPPAGEKPNLGNSQEFNVNLRKP
jgi:hypothetical protein